MSSIQVILTRKYPTFPSDNSTLSLQGVKAIIIHNIQIKNLAEGYLQIIDLNQAITSHKLMNDQRIEINEDDIKFHFNGPAIADHQEIDFFYQLEFK